MNKETTELIEKLAAKLGTTAEHLWGVLIKQAPISSATDVLLIITAVTASIWLSQRANKAFNRSEELGGEPFIAAVIGYFIAALLAAVVAVDRLLNISLIISGFLNPEYWALKQVIP